jgi:hypothetical protein
VLRVFINQSIYPVIVKMTADRAMVVVNKIEEVAGKVDGRAGMRPRL